MKFSSILSLSSFAALVSAHGYVQDMIISGKTYPGFLPFTDLWDKPSPAKITRKIPSDFPILDFTSADLTCNQGAQDAAWRTSSHAPIAAGSEMSFQWVRWPVDHAGPVTTYMAHCGDSCQNFDGTKDKVWFKIDELGLVSGTTDTGVWATTLLIKNNLTWTVTIPQSLKPGAYLVRTEILALHAAKAPQFYPSCAQVVVTGSGASFPSADEMTAIPGQYKSDTSTQIDIWQNGQTSYPIAGPPVTKLAKFKSDPLNQKGGLGPVPFIAGNIVTKASGTSTSNGSNSNNVTTGSSSSAAPAATTSSTKASACKAKRRRNAEAKRMLKRHASTRDRKMEVSI